MVVASHTENVFSKKREAELYDEMRSLPIRMKDRRELYADLEAIYDFASELQEVKKEKKIPFFRLRLYFQMLKYKFTNIGLWEHSLREIEIQRGTLTANVFYFIRWTLFFNLVLALIAFLGMLLPYAIYSQRLGRSYDTLCPKGWNQTDPDRLKLDGEKLAQCCLRLYDEKEIYDEMTNANSKFKNFFKIAKYLGGHTSSILTTPFFYGFYSVTFLETGNNNDSSADVLLPVLYSLSVISIIVVSFCILVKAIGDGVAEVVRNKDGDVCIFSELVFCGFWHRAQDENEARFRRKLWLHNLRVAIKQAKAIAKSTKPSAALVTKRWICFVASIILILLFALLIYYLATYCYDEAQELRDRAEVTPDENKKLVLVLYSIAFSLAPSIGIAAGNGILPNVFIKVGRVENYSLETSTVIVLVRSLVVRLLSVGLAIYRVISSDYICLTSVENTCTLCPSTDLRAAAANYRRTGTYEREACWESHLGRELYKIIFTELAIKVLLTFLVDPGRKLLKRLFYQFKIMRKVGTLSFSVIRHSLDIINIQVMSWLGFYFAPAFPLAVVFYLFVIFYVKKFSALVNCVGTPEAYKVSRTTTIFLLGELVSFVIVVIFLIVVLGYFEPSKACGPFAEYKRTWEAFQIFEEPGSNPSSANTPWWRILIRNLLSMSVYVPLQICAIAWLIHKYYNTVANRDYYESLKDLIILENQDKQYLVNRLLRLRAEYHNINYFDPVSIYDSEQKYVESTNKRLIKQWQALAQVKKDSGPAAEQWYRGIRQSHVSGSKGFPTLDELQRLVAKYENKEPLYTKKPSAKSSSAKDTESRGRKKKRKKVLVRKKKLKVPEAPEEPKPYSAPPMRHLFPKRKHESVKETAVRPTSEPPPPKPKRASHGKKKAATETSASSTSNPTSSEREPLVTVVSEAGLKRRKPKALAEPQKTPKAKDVSKEKKKKEKKKRKVAPSMPNEEESRPESEARKEPEDETTEDDELKDSYLWDYPFALV